MQPITVQACAKINLTLDVFNRRSDGFHSLASVVQAISLRDTLEIRPSPEPGIRLVVEGANAHGVPADDSNLVCRAARKLLDLAHCDGGLDVRLHKLIPSQAGLGGGSSDAAAALLGVAAAFGLDIGPKVLHDIAAGLGSDVPFFLSGGTAVMRGRGDNIAPVADPPRFWMVVVKPDIDVSTAWAYGALDAIPERVSNRATKAYEEAIMQSDSSRLAMGQSNDFELPVFAHFPALAWIRDELQMAGACAAHLCGSGSAVYGIAASERQAAEIARLMQKSYPRTYSARTLSRIESNPLRELPR